MIAPPAAIWGYTCCGRGRFEGIRATHGSPLRVYFLEVVFFTRLAEKFTFGLGDGRF